MVGRRRPDERRAFELFLRLDRHPVTFGDE
jgi:hypothetical protein